MYSTSTIFITLLKKKKRLETYSSISIKVSRSKIFKYIEVLPSDEQENAKKPFKESRNTVHA